MKVLVTGFEPFGGEPTNPSWEAVRRLPQSIGGHEIVTALLPVEYDRAAAELARLLLEHEPDAAVCCGQAGGRAAITPELAAVNCAESSAPDAAGVLRSGERLTAYGADGYLATLDVRKGIAAMNDAGIPAALSRSAGGYVCNAVMYAGLLVSSGICNVNPAKCGEKFAFSPETDELLVRASAKCAGMKCGFVHVPFEAAQAARRGRGEPSLELSQMVRGLEIFIENAI